MPEKPFLDPPGVSVGLTDRMFDLFVAQGQPAEELALTVEKLAERLLRLGDSAGLTGLNPAWKREGSVWHLRGWQVGRNGPGGWTHGAWYAFGPGGYVRGQGRRELHPADSLRDAMRAVERLLSEIVKQTQAQDVLTGVGQKLSEGL